MHIYAAHAHERIICISAYFRVFRNRMANTSGNPPQFKNYLLIFLLSICPEASVLGGGLEEGGVALKRQTTPAELHSLPRTAIETIEMQDMK